MAKAKPKGGAVRPAPTRRGAKGKGGTSDGGGPSTGRARAPRLDRSKSLAVGAPAVTGATRETRAGGKGTGKEDKDNGKGPAQAQGKGKAAAADDPQAPVDSSDEQPAPADSSDESENMPLEARTARTARLDALTVAPAAAADGRCVY